MKASVASVLLLATLVASSLAHICILAPDQRGGADVSSPGNPTCFQPDVAPANPVVTLRGGTIYYVLIQQNLNHFNVGWPGFIDIAFGQGFNQTSDEEFLDRNAYGDYWPHMQTNFSIPVLVPNADCEHCTLRARYHPNKPTEPIFHNCADIAISHTPDMDLGFSLFATYRSYGQTTRQLLEEVQTNSAFYAINPVSGFVDEIVPVGERVEEIAPYTQAQGLATVSASSTSTIAYIGQYRRSNVHNVTPNVLIEQSASGSAEAITLVNHTPAVGQWSGFTATGSPLGPYAIVGQIENPDGSFSYTASIVNEDGYVNHPKGTTPIGEFTFVNIFWTDYNSCNDELYLLAGDENSLTALNVMLYTFDMVDGGVTGVLVDNSEYTISSIHSDPQSCSSSVYAMSPGLVDTPADELVWSLIQIDPRSGSVTDAVAVTEPGMYNAYYGGGVYGNAVCKNQLTHLFQRSSDQVVEGLVIDMSNGSTIWSFMPNVGVNNANDILNPVAHCNN